MLPAELLELARAVCRQKAESQTLELKSARVGCPKRLYDTLSSFSNQDGGGVLLFGIDESEGWRVVGVYDPQDLQQKVAAQCARWSRRCGRCLRWPSGRKGFGFALRRCRGWIFRNAPATTRAPAACRALTCGWEMPTSS